MKFLVALAGALALASSANAVTYDAYDSFNGTQGAGGFFYLKMPIGPGAPTPLSPSSGCVVTSDSCLQDSGGLPGAYKSLTAFDEGTYAVPDDRLLVHPGPANAIGVFFVAPEAAVYNYTASFDILDRSPTGVFLNSFTNAGGAPFSQPLGVISGASPTLTQTGSVSLAKGQVLGFMVHNAGNYANDSTGLDFTLTTGAVPEPATWAMMILGFGLAGATFRRRAAHA